MLVGASGSLSKTTLPAGVSSSIGPIGVSKITLEVSLTIGAVIDDTEFTGSEPRTGYSWSLDVGG